MQIPIAQGTNAETEEIQKTCSKGLKLEKLLLTENNCIKAQ